MWPMCTALNGSYLVQAWNLEEDLSNTQFGVYDYRQTLSCGDYLISESDERPIVVIVFENDMEFIHKDIFAMSDIDSRSLLIYEIGPAASLNLLHRVDVYTRLWSAVRWAPGASIITTMNVDRTELRGVVIPHDSSNPPTIVVLGRYKGNKSSECRLGTRLFATTKGKVHNIFRYDWDFNSPVNHERALTPCQVKFSVDLHPFDEDIGRFLAYTNGMQLIIYGFI
ncbi:hypothetical protein Agabi119p4_10646 [Agaricus bisporus var. burnettii]|uniref:Uncharacterized protein n=1 Tax=Agaricus bisporus var. burnettii TaxID=192524 RepID=A0A8H7C2E8_AGABI|nr:hypothetical protein Agabi119p4_10646 [Agaricus bisporus var. burnettii]